MKTIPIDYLRQCFSYDGHTGVITWLYRPRGHFSSDKGHRISLAKHAGREAGHVDKGHGYRVIGLTYEGRFLLYQSHRIAWALFYGEWPNGEVDHVNCDTGDNRITNLRKCSHVSNMANQRGRNSKSGLKGAYWHARSQKWQASICVNYKQIHLGYFDTKEDAHDAYVSASAIHHGSFAKAA